MGKEEPKKTEAPPAPATEEPCDDCPGGKKEVAPEAPKETRTPIKTITVQGKPFHFYDQKEIDEHLSKGADYTKKTQALADEKRGLTSRFDQLETQYNQLQERLALMTRQDVPPEKKQTAPDQPPQTIFERYGVDPEYLEPWQKKQFEEMERMEQVMGSYKGQVETLREATQLMFMDKSLDIITKTIKQTKEEYPIEPVLDENGKDLSSDIFINILENKMRSNPKAEVPTLAKESVIELHKIQSLVKGQGRAEAKDLVIPDDSSPEDFQAKYPTLAQKISEAAVANYLAKRGEVPPTLERKGGAVDTSRVQSQKGNGEPSSLEDAFEQGWEAEGKQAFKDLIQNHS